MASEEDLADEAVELARRLLDDALRGETRAERRRRLRLGRLLADPDGRELILALTDEVLRIRESVAAAGALRNAVRRHRTDAMGMLDRAMLRVGAELAPLAPRLIIPLVARRVRHETHGVVLPADDPAFHRHLERRQREGVRLNVNPLGEAILSDAEADARMASVLAMIGRPDVDYVSVKISAIVANLDVYAFDRSIARVCEQLRILYRAGDAATPRTFVNLDMEEYGDLELTIHSFMTVLDEAEFIATNAGIVLQAYLPDSHDAAARIADWAIARRARHGETGRIKVRVVKGANLAMELVEAEVHGWVAAPYDTKADVDASYKALLDTLLAPPLQDVLDIGLASHNLFDVAWAIISAREAGATQRVQFEMLEGMAPAQARQVHIATGGLLMYSPVVAADDFEASIAYLTRRLDENTQPSNFLRALFTLTADSDEFEQQAEMFCEAVRSRRTVSHERRRRRLGLGDHLFRDPRFRNHRFTNEPASDLTDDATRRSIADALVAFVAPTPPVVDDEQRVDEIVATAAAAPQATASMRRTWLESTAEIMRVERCETLAVMAHETAKTVHEGDPEVSEAIDFCEYYADQGIGQLERLVASGFGIARRGVVAVVAPWNFPYAIPAGGVAAALAAGNAVILKPAPEAVEVGTHLAEQFWRGGVPVDVLQLLVCEDGPIGRRFVTHPDVDTVVLTGSLATAQMFLDWRPALRLFGETSGKNSMIVTATADLDGAIADTVHSAFGHAGQKCSAASLAIVEASVYDGPSFLPRLAAAARSLRVGAASDPSTMMGSVIGAPTGPLQRALNTLEPGERWLVEPTPIGSGGCTWTPGVRVGVAPGSWFHRTECFGPVLGVMRADDLDHAIELQNATDFGLTGGLHSLDESQIERWLDRVEVGNAYVNRQTTGAVVRRQPFGGWKHSNVGGGAKAGGPGYVLQFADVTDEADGDSIAERAERSYRRAWDLEFVVDHDPSGLRSEANILRYRPLGRIAVRHDGDQDDALVLMRLAADITGVTLIESDRREEDDAAFVARLGTVDRIRLLTSLDDVSRAVCHRRNIPIDPSRPVSDGDVELRRWVREQTVSWTMHRHGRLVARSPLPTADRGESRGALRCSSETGAGGRGVTFGRRRWRDRGHGRSTMS